MDELEQRIFVGLQEALSHHTGAEISTPEARRGLASGGPETPVIRLSMEDVARVAAQAARGWF